MAVTLDATLGGPTANSTVTLAEASQIAALRVGGDAWLDLGDDDLLSDDLVFATADIDRREYSGAPVSLEQALAWPRVGARGRGGLLVPATSIPYAIKQATVARAIERRQQIVAGQVAAPRDPAIKRVAAGDVEVEFATTGVALDSRVDVSDLSPIVLGLIAPFLVSDLPVISNGWGSSVAVRGS